MDWVDEVVDQSGGYLEDDILHMEPFAEDDDEEVAGAIIPKQELRFYDGTLLVFDQLVTSEAEVDVYHYAYMFNGGPGICRLDKHPGHEDVAGGLAHLHVGPHSDQEVIYPSKHYDFDDAIVFVREYARTRLGVIP